MSITARVTTTMGVVEWDVKIASTVATILGTIAETSTAEGIIVLVVAEVLTVKVAREIVEARDPSKVDLDMEDKAMEDQETGDKDTARLDTADQVTLRLCLNLMSLKYRCSQRPGQT